jgi:hypothetical protein
MMAQSMIRIKKSIDDWGLGSITGDRNGDRNGTFTYIKTLENINFTSHSLLEEKQIQMLIEIVIKHVVSDA